MVLICLVILQNEENAISILLQYTTHKKTKVK